MLAAGPQQGGNCVCGCVCVRGRAKGTRASSLTTQTLEQFIYTFEHNYEPSWQSDKSLLTILEIIFRLI